MLKDCLEIFDKYKGSDDSVILDSYILAEGDYIVVKKDGSLDHCFIKFDKKTRTVENKPMNYDKLCFYDYYSSLVSMNKPIDNKKVIHSNNYLSFFVKQDNLHSGKLTEKVIENFYDTLAKPEGKYTKKSEKGMYKNVEEKLGKVDVEKLKSSKKWILNNILNIGEENEIKSGSGRVVKLSGGKNYLKVFFEEDDDEYIKEGSRYFLMKMYNNNDYSVEINKDIFGLPNDNMGLNSKKPFLEHKNQKNTVPYLITTNEALLQKKFFDYLMNQANLGKNIIYLDNSGELDSEDIIEAKKIGEEPENKFSGYMLVIKKGTEAGIIYQDMITFYRDKLKRKFRYKNLTGNVGLEEVVGTIDTKKELQSVLNEIMFFKFLVGNYFTDVGEISLAGDIGKGNLKNYLVLSRDAIFNWLYKDNEYGMKKVVNNIFPLIVRESINKGYMNKAIQQFNLYLSLKEYFEGDEKMGIDYVTIEKELFKKIDGKTKAIITSDEEYYYAIGQLVKYYITKNKTKDKKHSLANPFINAKDNTFLRERLLRAFKKYNYNLSFGDKRFNNLYGMILVYNNAGKVNQDAIVAGYLRENIIYKKNEETSENNSTEEVK